MDATRPCTVEEGHTHNPSPWGPWATIGISIFVGLVFLFANVFTAFLFLAGAMVRNPEMKMESYLLSLEANGFYLAITTCFAGLVSIACLLLAAKLRKGITIRDYFAFQAVPLPVIVKWLSALIVFIVLSDSLTLLLKRPIVPEFMTDTYSSARFPILFWLALVVWAPLFEEMFFRGFLFAGLVGSRLGAVGTVVFTSATWSVIHLQYDLYGIVSIFVGGLLLGFARWKSGSMFPCLAMHAFMNVIATAQTVFVLSGGESTSAQVQVIGRMVLGTW